MNKVLAKKDCDSSKVSEICVKLIANPDIARLIGGLLRVWLTVFLLIFRPQGLRLVP